MYKIYEINKNDKEYPENLLKIQKHPQKLYVMGNVKILNNKSVAMVGSRDSTPYGEYYASNFAKALSKSGITVVSGLAIGIDTVCHKNSMKEKGKTIAVIGSGFNHIYPKENIDLVEEILKNGGAVISEYPPNTEVNLSNFPIRNRIIAGLSECTIVVEAKFRSGSSVTARHSKLQGKKVYCIPGRIGDKTGKGTNNLIKKGAVILTDVNEILSDLGKEKIQIEEKIKGNKSKIKEEGNKLKVNSEKYKSIGFEVEDSSARNTTKKSEISPIKNIKKAVKIPKEYNEIYKLLKETPMNVNEISRALNINIAEVNMKLTMMEIEGLIEVLPGNIIKIKET